MQYNVRRQLTVILENVPGRLANITAILTENGVNIEAVSISDSAELGVVRLVPGDASACRAVLMRRGLNVIESEVISMEVTEGPGKLAKVSRALADAGANVDYAYATTYGVGVKTRMVLKCSPMDKACKALDALKE